MELNRVINGDSLEMLKTLPSESVNCCVTSPPYWALRDYGVEGQLGLESTFTEYIDKLCNIFDEVKRVLRKDGTLWVNLGDTYSAANSFGCVDNKYKSMEGNQPKTKRNTDLQDKCLCQIPARFSIEMTNRGWILRNEIIWHKPNCMPSSVSDRFTVDFEKVFFFVKSKKYYFEQQLDPYTEPMKRWGGNVLKADGNSTWDDGVGQNTYRNRDMRPNEEGRNKRCVWSICPQPFSEAHFAVYPETLIEPMIKAGCPKGGVVLDVFGGSGTTGVVAKKQDKNYILIELNPEYCKMAQHRIDNTFYQFDLWGATNGA